MLSKWSGVLLDSVVKCFSHNPSNPGYELHWIFWGFFFAGVSLGKTFQKPSLVFVKSRKQMNAVSCLSDMTEILLKAV